MSANGRVRFYIQYLPVIRKGGAQLGLWRFPEAFSDHLTVTDLIAGQWIFFPQITLDTKLNIVVKKKNHPPVAGT